MNAPTLLLYAALIWGSSTALASGGPIGTEPARTEPRCQANILGPRAMVDFVSYSQFIADDYRHIDYALHLGDISPHIARGQFLMLNVDAREKIIVVVSRSDDRTDRDAFSVYLIPLNQYHLARATSELDGAVGGRLLAIVRDHYLPRDVRIVADEKVGLAYVHVKARRGDLDRYNTLLRRLTRLVR